MHGIDSIKFVKSVIECCDVADEEVQDSIDTLTSWFVANNGFRSRFLMMPDNVHQGYQLLEQQIRSKREQHSLYNNGRTGS